eukprot:gene1389-32758_t
MPGSKHWVFIGFSGGAASAPIWARASRSAVPTVPCTSGPMDPFISAAVLAMPQGNNHKHHRATSLHSHLDYLNQHHHVQKQRSSQQQQKHQHHHQSQQQGLKPQPHHQPHHQIQPKSGAPAQVQSPQPQHQHQQQAKIKLPVVQPYQEPPEYVTPKTRRTKAPLFLLEDGSSQVVPPKPPIQKTGNKKVSYEHDTSALPQVAEVPPAPQALPSLGPACSGCGLLLGTGPTLHAVGQSWHPSCLRCGHCNKTVAEGGKASYSVGKDGLPYHKECYNKVYMKCGLCKKTVVVEDGKSYLKGKNGKPYHEDCYAQKFSPICTICESAVPISRGSVQYNMNKFWREKYCSTHDLEAWGAKCASCSRGRPEKEEWKHVGHSMEGHTLCKGCSPSLMIESFEAQPLYTDIITFYKSLGMELPSRPPLMLVDGKTLKQHAGKEGRATTLGGPIFHVRGLTLSKIHRTVVNTVRGGMNKGGKGYSVRQLAVSLPSVKNIKCTVSAILVYSGFPRLLSGSIIAHELLHAYLRLKNITGLKLQNEEGLAQLMAFLWLETQHTLLEGKKEEQRLACYFAFEIRKDTSAIYGDGFRMANKAYLKAGGGSMGLAHVLQHVEKHDRFP